MQPEKYTFKQSACWNKTGASTGNPLQGVNTNSIS
jgi:hypothetical protein